MSGRLWFRQACIAVSIASASFVACSGWDPSRPFEREAPEVRESITHLGDAGDAQAAMGILEEYLVTGQCKEGNIGTPNRVRERSNGTFDLGLALFKIGEAFGKRFGEEEIDGGHMDGPLKTMRQEKVECGLRIVRAIATDPSQPIDLRARARFLEGNLCFLDQRYEDAVKAYDQSLELIPGMTDSGPISAVDSGRASSNADALGRDTAWNRAIALRRIEDKKDAGKDGGDDGGGDGGGDSGKSDGGGDKNDDGGNGKSDGGNNNDSGAQPDAGKDGGDDPQKNDDKKPKEDPKDAGPPPPSRQNQDERMLDQLENAPTVQQEVAKKHGPKRPVRGMNDK